jgi:hypothetical protein
MYTNVQKGITKMPVAASYLIRLVTVPLIDESFSSYHFGRQQDVSGSHFGDKEGSPTI